jgi:hypothetical protein
MIRTLVVEVDPEDTVESLKNKIAGRAGFLNLEMMYVNVVFNGRILDENENINRPLVNYGIGEGSNVRLVPRMYDRQLQIVGGYFTGEF